MMKAGTQVGRIQAALLKYGVEYAKNDGWACTSTGWTAQAKDTVNPKEVQGGISSQGGDSSKADSAWSGQAQVHSPHPASRIPSQQGRDDQGGDGWSSGHNHGTWNTNRSNRFQSSCGYGHEKQSVNLGASGQSSLGSGRSEQENSKRWSTLSSVEGLRHLNLLEKGGLLTMAEEMIHLTSQLQLQSQIAQAGWGARFLKTKYHPLLWFLVIQQILAGDKPKSKRKCGSAFSCCCSEPLKSASDWGEQHHVSVKPSLGGWHPHSDSASIPKPSETPDQATKLIFKYPNSNPKAKQWYVDRGSEYKKQMESGADSCC